MARRSKFGRFQVWNQGSDSWKHTDQAYNLDVLDRMIGGPGQNNPPYGVGDDFNNPTTASPSSTDMWLHPLDTTQIVNFGNRTLFNIVRALNANDVPLGAVFAWWRPSSDVPLPTGCVPADGSTYASTATHSYQVYGITSITVPDLRNKMILGANITNTDGAVATSPSVNTAAGAPGIRGVGGTNVPRNLAHTHTLGSLAVGSHQHSLSGHYHGMQHNHLGPANTGPPDTGSNHLYFISSGTAPTAFWADKGLTRAGGDHTHSITASGYVNGYAGPDSAIGVAGLTSTTGPYSGGGTEAFSSAVQPSISGTLDNALTTVDTLPQYVGLLWMVKILRASPLFD